MIYGENRLVFSSQNLPEIREAIAKLGPNAVRMKNTFRNTRGAGRIDNIEIVLQADVVPWIGVGRSIAPGTIDPGLLPE